MDKFTESMKRAEAAGYRPALDELGAPPSTGSAVHKPATATNDLASAIRALDGALRDGLVMAVEALRDELVAARAQIATLEGMLSGSFARFDVERLERARDDVMSEIRRQMQEGLFVFEGWINAQAIARAALLGHSTEPTEVRS